jgi:thiol-disulfide isomerase/thioredoxin
MYVRKNYITMGKSYAEKVRSKQKRNTSTRNTGSGTSKMDDERKNKFPMAPVIVIGVVFALIIATIAIYQSQDDDDGGYDPNEGGNGGNGGGPSDNLPDYAYISLENVNGGIFSLEQYERKVVIIDMFATWCGPCALQMEELLDLQTKYSPNDVVILSIDTDLQETTADVLNFKADYPTAEWVFGMSNSEFNSYFPASSIPTTYILDGDLNIVKTDVGVTSSADLQETINSII